jgi:acetyltransferase-like isoleucine patch superfamily enzyme
MINDHRPYLIKSWYIRLENWYAHHFVSPQLAQLGSGYHLMKPWNISVHGSNIRIGKNVHVVATRDRKVGLSTWTFKQHQGNIDIGDHCLLCPGVRIDSASQVTIEDNCMLAAGCYVTDADWHDIYDRTEAVGTSKPVHLKNNVWIGDSAIICKGVTIGANSIIGAGAVVAGDIPENSIAAGNPAVVIKTLDPERALIKRETIFQDPLALAHQIDQINRYALGGNSLYGWLRNWIFPKRGD